MPEDNGPWFVGDNSNGSGVSGFTNTVDKALKDKTGAPIMAGGAIRRLVSVVVGRMEAVQKKKLDMMWEVLFDIQDKVDQESQRLSFFTEQKEDVTAIQRQMSYDIGMRRGLIAMISIQQNGNAEPSAIAMIEQELKEAYEEDDDGSGSDPAPALRAVGEAGGNDSNVLPEGEGGSGEAVGTGQPDREEEPQAVDPRG